MRTRLALALAVGLAPACRSPSQPAAPASAPAAAPAAPVAPTTTTAAAGEWGTGVVHRGAAFTATTQTALKAVLAEPGKFAGQVVKTEGLVARACAKKGCWMELQLADGTEASGMRVTFKDYGFFVPLDSAGAQAIIEGTVEIKTLSKEDAAHLESEGARVTRNDKGEAIELAFVASGVELTR